MKTRTLPRVAVQLTELGLGTSQMGNLGCRISDEDAADVLRMAWKLGVRHIDTAPHYGLGLSERRLGALLVDYPREDYVVSTKVGRLLVPMEGLQSGSSKSDSEGFDVPVTHRRVWDFSADGVRRSLEQSLRRLGLDRVDIAYLHDPDEHWEQASVEAVPALIQLRDEGVVRAVGVGVNHAELAERFVRETDIDVVMIAGRYTLLEQGAGQHLLPAALLRGVGVVAAAVYNSGVLSTEHPAPNATYDYRPVSPHMLQRALAVKVVCERHGVTLPEAAIQFVLRHPAITSVVVGARSDDQIAAAGERYDAHVPDELWADLTGSGLLGD